MAYIGKQPVVGKFVKLDAIVTSATATYNLLNGGVAYSPQSANNCIVSLNGIIQEPTSSGNVGGYTISGSTIVFTSALTSLDVIDFILVLGDTLSIGTPSDGTVSFAKVTSNLITGATAETSIAGGDSVLIYDDSATALRKMTRTNFIGGGNTPAFFVKLSSSQSLSDSTVTKLQLNDELIDTDSAFDSTTNYRFTVPTGKGGRYSISYQVGASSYSAVRTIALIKKNGTIISESEDFNSTATLNTAGGSYILDLADADYIELFGYQNSGGSASIRGGTVFHTFLSGYKIIT